MNNLKCDVCPDCVIFTSLAPWECSGGEVCSICRYHIAYLDYELNSDDCDFQPMRGYCCIECAANLIAAMEKLQPARLKNIDSHEFRGVPPTNYPAERSIIYHM